MIDEICFSEQYILEIQKKFKARDKMLVERVIYALYLLQELSNSGLKFIFKGGTSLLLLLDAPRRFSIDVDIQVDHEIDLSPMLELLVSNSSFISVKEQNRKVHGNILKRHYHLKYISHIDKKEYPILLDVVFGPTPYENIIEKKLTTLYLKQTTPFVSVYIPDRDNILADKLTAFAPTTIGIKLGIDKSMEIMKQFYDIAVLSEKIDNLDKVRSVYVKFIEIQNKYRGSNYTKEEIINDSIQALLAILSQGKHDSVGYFQELNMGIISIKNHIIYEPFSLNLAFGHAAKLLHLYSIVLMKNSSQLINKSNLDNNIENPKFQHLKFLKKVDPIAYCMLYESLKSLELFRDTP